MSQSPCRIVNPRVEYQTTPLGIDEKAPRFSWVIDDGRRGAGQSAYRIVVSAAGAAVWDSGVVRGGATAQVEYKGKTLAPRTQYEWQVQAWDHTGAPGEPSAVQSFETGLLKTERWAAQWIEEAREEFATMRPVAYLRKGFVLDGPVQRARLYATALGVYEARINGMRVGDTYLAPGWTKYEKRVQYQTCDVTALLKAGENAIGALLGDGWYCGEICGAWNGKAEHMYGNQPRFRAELAVLLQDGSEIRVCTDTSWRCRTGAIEYSDIYMGEKYDARAELDGWDRAGCDESAWQAVRVTAQKTPPVVAQAGPPVRITRQLRAKTVTQPAAGVWVIDLGQNMVGWERLSVSGPAGTEIRVRHAEMLNPDGTVYLENLRRAKAISTYVLKGGGVEVFEPHFTFYGFQYVEITGFPGEPSLDTLSGMVLHSDMPLSGDFECSDPLINQLQHNIEWGQRGNYLDVPTDCPQRDERLGWTGDAQVFVRTAAHVFDIAGFFTKWLWDLDDSQAPDGRYPHVAPELPGGDPGGASAWADAGVICPWTIYQCYGDTRILERHYPAMKKWVDYQKAQSRGYLLDRAVFGDWLSINADTPRDLVSTAFFAFTTQLLSQAAAVLGKKGDAKKYAAMAHNVKAAFNREFVAPNGRLVGETQTSVILALHFGLLSGARKQRAMAWLVRDIERRKDHLSCGFVGSPYINHVLSAGGRDDVAYRLLHQTGWPSWLYAVTQGATTIWERWDGWTHDKGFQSPSMNSFNHYAYGAIGEWLYAKVAGIDIDASRPGYRRIVIEPHPGGNLTYAKASLESIRGRIESGWRREGNAIVYSVTIPANTTAVVKLPAAAISKVREGGKKLDKADGCALKGVKNGRVEIAIGAGSYEFEVRGTAGAFAGKGAKGATKKGAGEWDPPA